MTPELIKLCGNQNGGLNLITERQVSDLVRLLVENVKPEKIILFGSYAKGNPGSDSDLDIAIIKDSSLPTYKRCSEIRKHLRGLKFPVDIFVFTKEEFKSWGKVKPSLIHDIIQTGKLLYG